MALNKIKKTIGTILTAATIALTPATSKALTEKELLTSAPKITQTIVNNDLESRAAVLGFNVVFDCIKSGIGSYIKHNGFASGCGKGALAGIVAYIGEETATHNKYPMLGATGKLIHDLGTSMSDNVMRGEGMLSQYQTELGPATLTFKEDILPQVSFTITPAVAITRNLLLGQKFDAKQSLYNLTPVFQIPAQTMNVGSKTLTVGGYTTGNVISYTPMPGINSLTLSHEMNHALFWSKFRFGGDLINATPYLSPPKLVQRWLNLGQEAVVSSIFMPEMIDINTYYYNLHELEAFSMQRM